MSSDLGSEDWVDLGDYPDLIELEPGNVDEASMIKTAKSVEFVEGVYPPEWQGRDLRLPPPGPESRFKSIKVWNAGRYFDKLTHDYMTAMEVGISDGAMLHIVTRCQHFSKTKSNELVTAGRSPNVLSVEKVCLLRDDSKTDNSTAMSGHSWVRLPSTVASEHSLVNLTSDTEESESICSADDSTAVSKNSWIKLPSTVISEITWIKLASDVETMCIKSVQAESEKIPVVVQNLLGKSYRMSLGSSEKILSIKIEASKHLGIPVENQRVVYRGKELPSDISLQDAGVSKGAVLWSYTRLPRSRELLEKKIISDLDQLGKHESTHNLLGLLLEPGLAPLLQGESRVSFDGDADAISIPATKVSSAPASPTSLSERKEGHENLAKILSNFDDLTREKIIEEISDHAGLSSQTRNPSRVRNQNVNLEPNEQLPTIDEEEECTCTFDDFEGDTTHDAEFLGPVVKSVDSIPCIEKVAQESYLIKFMQVPATTSTALKHGWKHLGDGSICLIRSVSLRLDGFIRTTAAAIEITKNLHENYVRNAVLRPPSMMCECLKGYSKCFLQCTYDGIRNKLSGFHWIIMETLVVFVGCSCMLSSKANSSIRHLMDILRGLKKPFLEQWVWLKELACVLILTMIAMAFLFAGFW
eukprot:CAMPEP_0114520640 /NCGR_PEP_ID=MMETSP0109-20121206/19717_1 /TAXON_ID=29199 /ORGANISM="Chlorarachnion reptans, Strain CCCM449" /LENGTH=641 /DNA_ID=CAMNT_0001701605 /DNA_START=120 /DNA_END=2042 /DNA_ORIENTATION=+